MPELDEREPWETIESLIEEKNAEDLCQFLDGLSFS